MNLHSSADEASPSGMPQRASRQAWTGCPPLANGVMQLKSCPIIETLTLSDSR